MFFLDHPTYDAHKVDDSAVVNPNYTRKQAQKKAARDAARLLQYFVGFASFLPKWRSYSRHNRIEQV